ncbi:arylacetamide deacetylase-like 3 [Crotalus adamanteus]|uniref:Arylacetamide deacetylase-like 3 n=1 Tax=Crotalus adamanteus TaxID=8729 RepID=A0AAW1ARJ4_CROAD
MLSYGKRLACLLVGGAIYPAVFLLSALIQYRGTVFPPGIDQPLKARIYQTIVITGLILIRRRDGEGFPSVKGNIPPPEALQLGEMSGPVTSNSYERVLRHVAKEGDATVVAVGYGLAPENLYPSQYIECLKAVVYLMKHSEDYGVDSSRIIISGDSCGANFATRICQLLVDRRDLPKVHAQVLIYPGLQGLDFSLPSYQQNCRSPLMWKKLIAYLCCRYLNKSTSFVNEILKSSHVPKATRLKYQKWLNANNIPEQFKVRGYREQDHTLSSFNPQFHKEMKEMLSETFSPLLAEDAVVCKLPQTFLLTCEFDVLRDDGLLYMKRLIDNGVPVTWSHVENGMHGIMPLFGYGILSFPSAKRTVHDVTDFIRRLREPCNYADQGTASLRPPGGKQSAPRGSFGVSWEGAQFDPPRGKGSSDQQCPFSLYPLLAWLPCPPKWHIKAQHLRSSARGRAGREVWSEGAPPRPRSPRPSATVAAAVLPPSVCSRRPDGFPQALLALAGAGLPRKYILTHCEEARHQHLVSQYDDQYNRHGHNPQLPPLRKWHRHKLAWTPEKSDYPLVEPPTNYGLVEHLMKAWHRKETEVAQTVYHSSYPKPPASAYAPRQRPDTRRILEQSRQQWLPRSLDAPA